MNDDDKDLIVATVAAIPIVGGTISVLVDKFVPSELKKRRDSLIKQFDSDIEDIKEKIKPGQLESEEYITILFKVFKSAIEEHNQEKIKRFRAILKNSAIDDNIQNPEIEFYIKVVNDLTLKHFEVLTHLYSGFLFSNGSKIEDFCSPEHMNIDKDYLKVCIDDLLRLNLLSDKKEYIEERIKEIAENGFPKDSPFSDKDYYLIEKRSHIPTSLGERFYSFIKI